MRTELRRTWPRYAMVALALLATSVVATAPGAAAQADAPRVAPGTNLLVNPGAESGTGGDGYTTVAIPGWTASGGVTVVKYSTGGGFPVPTDPGAAGRGANYFVGGPNTAASAVSQTVDVSGDAAGIDANTVGYDLSGALGGYTTQDDRAALTATFQNAAGTALGSAQVGPVLSADRGGVTGFVVRRATGAVPAGTRRILVALTTTRAGGSYDDGYADDLALSLTAVTTSANLLANGDAEFGDPTASGYDAVTVPGWTAAGTPTVVGYATGGGFPTATDPGPTSRGAQFFTGGPVGTSTLTQTVDVTAAASQIGAGGVTYDLSGWLGGYAAEISTATLTVTFRTSAGASVGTAAIGPVTAANRGNATSLLRRAATGAVPATTRTITAVLSLTGDPARANRYNDAYADSLALTLSTPVAVPAITPPPSTVPGVDHVFYVVMENRSYDQVLGNSAAPYLTQLAADNVTLRQSYGVVHPSDPNYVAFASGSTQGLTTNPPFSTSIDAPHIGDRLEAAGKTWKGYIEGMSAPCDLVKNGDYDPDNLPFLFFKDMKDTTRCRNHLQPITQLWSDLGQAASTPNLVWFEPNSCGSMHNCSTATGDTWMRNNLPKIFASPAWTQQRSLLVVTFDEDDSAHGQRIPTLLVGSPGLLKPRFVTDTQCASYQILRTVEQGFGVPPMTRNDRYAAPLNEIFAP